jgi:xanthine dehydrogenase large subunit
VIRAMPEINKNIPHDSACTHVTGESIYIDDMPMQGNELLVDFLGSPFAHCQILSLNLDEALVIPGVVALYTYKDLGGINKFGPILQDEVLLCEDHCSFIGEPIVVIAAESRLALAQAKKAIKLEVKELKPVLTIDDARQANQFIDRTYSIGRGNCEKAFAEAANVIEGTLKINGQDHFYLESQAAIVYPGEQNQLVVHSSTQNSSEVQQVLALVLGLQQNQITVIVKRLGGGFGGKECQATHPAAMAALVALKTKRPARIVYSKDDDMMFTGKRHPFQNDYKVAFNDDGVMTALSARLFADGGAANDLSTAVLGRALTHIDNAYFIENVDVKGQICRTNFPPTTAFRGFGGPQGVVTMENIIEEIAAFLNIDSFDVRRRNCYGLTERNVTHYGQLITNNTLPRLFDELYESSDYRQRARAVADFNAKSRTHLKGISLQPVKFGISFTNKFLNQANALVNVYLDGTVQVSTGACEMGQGVNTNIKQLVADEFQIDPQQVIVMATSTEKSNNTSPTAASAATDLNGSAAVDACIKIKANMATSFAAYLAREKGFTKATADNIVFRNGMLFDPSFASFEMSFRDAVGVAYRDRQSLGERGYYATKGIDFDWLSGKGNPFLYFTNGCACAEVLIDRFTGQLKIERLDVLFDAGKQINPGINRGQVIGGMVQGIGWVTTEELRYGVAGNLLSHSPTTYKIPNIHDIPAVFNVNFIDNDANTANVRSTKAVGEPPLLLGISVWTAAKHALSFVSGDEIPVLDLPATNEQILSRLTAYEAASEHIAAPQRSRKAQARI